MFDYNANVNYNKYCVYNMLQYVIIAYDFSIQNNLVTLRLLSGNLVLNFKDHS